jgi:gliding motility-associated-like protein
MKNVFLFFLLCSCYTVIAQPVFPELADTLNLPCGQLFEYSHDSTGTTDPVGFRLVPELPCLPTSIHLNSGAFIVPDLFQIWVHDGVWSLLDDSGWHSFVYSKTVEIPSGCDDIMLISYNFPGDYTEWWVNIQCEYPPLSECCHTEFTLRGPSIVCPGDEAKISVDSVVGFEPFQFKWNVPGDSAVVERTLYHTRTFTVTVTDVYGCTGAQSLDVFVPPPPIVLADTTVCQGVDFVLPVIPGMTWYRDTIFKIQDDFTAIGITSDTFGCEHAIPYDISVYKMGHASPDTTVCQRRYVTLQVDNVATEYSWQNFAGEELSNKAEFPVFVVSDTAFILVATDSLGCRWQDTTNIQAWICENMSIYIPNVVMPEGAENPENGFWSVYLDPKAFGEVQFVILQIFDRWGNLVKECRGDEISWDGKTGDSPVPTGVYIWYATVQTMERTYVFAGDITVLR